MREFKLSLSFDVRDVALDIEALPIPSLRSYLTTKLRFWKHLWSSCRIARAASEEYWYLAVAEHRLSLLLLIVTSQTGPYCDRIVLKS